MKQSYLQLQRDPGENAGGGEETATETPSTGEATETPTEQPQAGASEGAE